ncbi:MAG: amylo-alpha-1,6-glucosidase [Planctomycetota bacterium]
MDEMRDLVVEQGGGAGVGFDGVLEREWLLTDGSGGYAMGTAGYAGTRRYHGLWVPAASPPVGRVVVLNSVFETLVFEGGQRVELGSAVFRGGDGGRVVVPAGHEWLTRCVVEAGEEAVRWEYAVELDGRGVVEVVRRLRLVEGGAAVSYAVSVGGLVELRLRPMVTLRDFHHLAQAAYASVTAEGVDGGRLRLRGKDGVDATLGCEGARFEASGDWWRGVWYPVETRRGQDDAEDVWTPGEFVVVGRRDGVEAEVTVGLGEGVLGRTGVGTARKASPSVGLDGGRVGGWLERAAGAFVVGRSVVLPGEDKRTRLATVLAGYPWFADWGRDAFIALPGLLLETGRFDAARDVLRTFASVVRDGLIPNRFDDRDPDGAIYNTVDGPLWFVHAALAYLEASEDRGSWDAWLGGACVSVLGSYAKGTRADGHDGRDGPRICMDTADGLIVAGDAGSQLTWMDAAYGGVVFTPRYGKAVEINALWVSGLRGVLGVAGGKPHRRLRHLWACEVGMEEVERLAADAFERVFWSEELGYLFDHVTEGGADVSCRPNQLIACSLERSPLSVERRRAVVGVCRERLLTPVGMRTLPVDDPEYRGVYAGPQFERDGAYHRGTIWPWLIGPYVEGLLRAGGMSEAARAEGRAVLEPLVERVSTTKYAGGMGSLAEIYQGDQEGGVWMPRGCPAQAWSVAEVLRVWRMCGG